VNFKEKLKTKQNKNRGKKTVYKKIISEQKTGKTSLVYFYFIFVSVFFAKSLKEQKQREQFVCFKKVP